MMVKIASLWLALTMMSTPATAQVHMISLDIRDAPLSDVLYMLAVQSGKNIVADTPERRDRVTLHVRDFTFDAVLGLLARLHGLDVRREGRVYVVSSRQRQDGSAGTPSSAASIPRAMIRLDIRVADVHLLQDQTRSVTREFGGTQLPTPASGESAFAFTKNVGTVNADVADLAAAGRLRILTSLTLVAPADRETGLLVGQQYPAALAGARGTTASVQLVEVGVRLRFKSSLQQHGSVTVCIRPQYSALEDAGNGAALTLGRVFEATLRVSKDETIVLGGLFGNVDAQAVTKLPFLGNLAVLGAVFRARPRGHPADEILFLIAPHVLENAPATARVQRGSRSQ